MPGHGLELDLNDPYVISAAGFWLRAYRAPQKPESKLSWKSYAEERAHQREVLECSIIQKLREQTEENSSSTTPTATS